MEKRVRRKDINKDRISELADHLKHKILSYLSIKEAASTALLSSSWKDLWLTLPCLHLGEDFFSNIMQKSPVISPSHVHILMFVYRILTRRSKCLDHQYNNTMLKELKIHIPTLNFTSKVKMPESTAFLLNKYLVWTIDEFQVKKLDFSVGYWIDYSHWRPNNFCDRIASLPISSTLDYWGQKAEITDLKLRGCMLDSCMKTQWSTLRSLSLNSIKFHQQAFDSLIANCLSLECLNLDGCIGEFDTLNASCLKRLVTLYIYDWKHSFKKIHIVAPGLEQFRYDDGSSVDESPCFIHGLVLSKRLKILEICSEFAKITDEWWSHIKVACLSMLKHL